MASREGFVVDEFARAFHGGEQGGLGEAGGRLGFLVRHFDVFDRRVHRR
jgi:hypothetical protein